MSAKIGPYQIVDFPAERRDVLDFIDLSSWQHRMYGLLEVDVTVVRRCLAAHKARTGESLSFTGYLAFCLGQAVNEHKAVQAYRQGRNQLALFDDVDIGMMIEHGTGAARTLSGYVIRRANDKTFLEIHREIRAVQTASKPPDEGAPAWLPLLRRLPGPATKLINVFVRQAIRRNPADRWVAMAGTVGISAVGMFGKSGGWGLAAPAMHTTCLYVGGIARKPACVQERIEPRDLLSLTAAFDHGVVDGAPAARFTARLVELIESGCGLDAAELMAAGRQQPEPANRS